MSEPDEKEDRSAKWRLWVPEDPTTSDVIALRFEFLEVIELQVKYPDSQRNEVANLLAYVGQVLDRAHLEYEVRRQATEIDQDLSQLFLNDPEEGQ